jgi:mRNA-degrading endonuclease RelE of RelBE toxin-antitoxin system
MGLRFAEDVQDFVRTLAPGPKRDIRSALRLIAEDPHHPGLDLKLLRKDGPYYFFRARVGDYRIVFAPVGDVVYIWRIQHRKEGYDWLDRLDPLG